MILSIRTFSTSFYLEFQDRIAIAHLHASLAACQVVAFTSYQGRCRFDSFVQLFASNGVVGCKLPIYDLILYRI
jgi:hypothetical protein